MHARRIKLSAMNTMLADSLNWMADKLEAESGAGAELTTAIIAVLKEVMDKHDNVVFGGEHRYTFRDRD